MRLDLPTLLRPRKTTSGVRRTGCGCEEVGVEGEVVGLFCLRHSVAVQSLRGG